MRRFLLIGASIFAITPALALNDTIAVTVGTGTTKTANLVKFGSNNVISEASICDATTENQCATVSAGGALTVLPGNTANTTPWLASISAGGNTASVKAASTSAAQTDLALVVRNPDLGAAGASHTCAGSFTATACLGQIDDDVKATGSVQIVPDTTTTTGMTPAVAGTTSSNVVGKASAGNLYNAYVTSSAAGWVFLINATSLPANATLTIGTASGNLQGCFELQKGVTDYQASINYNPGPTEHFSTGVVVAISSTDCPVLTAATTGKFLHAQVQ